MKEDNNMSFIEKIFGNRQARKIAAHPEKSWESSPEKQVVDAALKQVKLIALLLGIMGKWLALFGREKILGRAILELDEKEIKCLVDFFPEFLGKDG
jgi:hypothetical protein